MTAIFLLTALALVCLIYAIKSRLNELDAKREAKELQKHYDLSCKGIAAIYQSLSGEEQKKLRDLSQRKVFDDEGDDTVVYPLKVTGYTSRRITESQKRAQERLIWKEVYRHLVSKDS